MAKFSPYLLFFGKCAEAMHFYHVIFGGELKIIKISETPMKESMPEIMHNKVINAHLKSDLVEMSASDWLHPSRNPNVGNTVCLYIGGGSYDELKGYFDKLSEGCDKNTYDELSEKFYGIYGALTDQFGIRWMFQGDKKS